MPVTRYPLTAQPAQVEGSDIRLCLLDVKSLEDSAAFERSLPEVSAERAAKAVRFRFPSGKALSLGAGLALDMLLQEYGLREKDMRYGYGSNEKPYFVNQPGLHFNLSHSGTLVLACMGRRELGCDIQKEEKDQLSIARHFFHPDEYAWLSGISDETIRSKSFYRLWVCKESFIKTLGTGLSTELSSFCVPLWEEPGGDGQRKVTGSNGETCHLYELEMPVPGYRGAVGIGNESSFPQV